eukprot:gene26604-biopygen4176
MNSCHEEGIRPESSWNHSCYDIFKIGQKSNKTLRNPILEAGFKKLITGHLNKHGLNYILQSHLAITACMVQVGPFSPGKQDLGQESCLPSDDGGCDSSLPNNKEKAQCRNRGLVWCRCDGISLERLVATKIPVDPFLPKHYRNILQTVGEHEKGKKSGSRQILPVAPTTHRCIEAVEGTDSAFVLRFPLWEATETTWADKRLQPG